jgi:hypothetical protein
MDKVALEKERVLIDIFRSKIDTFDTLSALDDRKGGILSFLVYPVANQLVKVNFGFVHFLLIKVTFTQNQNRISKFRATASSCITSIRTSDTSMTEKLPKSKLSRS